MRRAPSFIKTDLYPAERSANTAMARARRARERAKVREQAAADYEAATAQMTADEIEVYRKAMLAKLVQDTSKALTRVVDAIVEEEAHRVFWGSHE